MKRHIRFGNMFSGPNGSLKVISRSFGGHLVTQNLKLKSAIDSASKKTYEKYNMPQKVRFGMKVMFTGHLRSFRGHLEVIWRLKTQI